ncbi:MAG: hypothetical protein NT007_09350 [Candidatus Kapabacteria bacterium]|nr:hypothetical protein [Candidatus Kapabacteria bacterium]
MQKLNRRQLLLLIIVLMISKNEYSFSQEYDSLKRSFISIGADKYIDKFTFTSSGNLNFNTDFGNFNINQNYRGSTLLDASKNFIDDEQFSLLYKKKIIDLFNFETRQRWLLNSNSRLIGLNKNEKIDFSSGLQYGSDDNSFIEALVGIQRNNMINLISDGLYTSAAANYQKINTDDFNYYLISNAEYVKLNLNRTNALANVSARLTRDYDADNSITFLMGYKLLKTNFLQRLAGSNSDYQVENWFENRFNGHFNLKFQLFSFINDFTVHGESNFFDDSYSAYNPKDSKTAAYKNKNEFVLLFNYNLKYEIQNFLFQIGLDYNLFSKSYDVNKKFEISDLDLRNLRNNEKMNDYNQNITQFSVNSFWFPSISDTFQVAYAVRLNQYASPSKLMNDDNDVFTEIFNLSASHRFSSVFSMKTSAYAFFNHNVYLKSQLSINNNWIRIYKFAPQVFINTEYFKMSPVFEVSANYTSYDYEDSLSSNSRSMRQISSRDSIMIFYKNSLNLQLIYNVRYYETGVFYSNLFEETPQQSNTELLTRCIIDYKVKNFDIGIGWRIFFIRSRKLNQKISVPDDLFQSVGPEFSSRIDLNKVIIQFNGWYEFQRNQQYFIKSVPNFFLKTEYRL